MKNSIADLTKQEKQSVLGMAGICTCSTTITANIPGITSWQACRTICCRNAPRGSSFKYNEKGYNGNQYQDCSRLDPILRDITIAAPFSI